MLILLDIGNTAITYGFYKSGKFISFGSIKHIDIPFFIKKIAKITYINPNILVVSSVVPKITNQIKKMTSHKNSIKLMIVGENLKIQVKNRYKNPKKIGIDRLVNVFGALKMHKAPLLLIDSGTAITLDYVSSKGVLEGGMIIPGPQTAYQALLHQAALIPKSLRLPTSRKKFLGNSTFDCLSSGILEGYGAMLDGLVDRFKKRYGRRLKVIATGGFMGNLKPYTHCLDILDPKHTLKSLYLLYLTDRRH